MPYCVPVCMGCVEAGSCHKGELPASAYVPAKRYTPRRAVAATYPRDVKPVYVHLACGHLTTKEAILFYSIWQPRQDEGQPQYRCETCKAWIEVSVQPISEQLSLEPPY